MKSKYFGAVNVRVRKKDMSNFKINIVKENQVLIQTFIYTFFCPGVSIYLILQSVHSSQANGNTVASDTAGGLILESLLMRTLV